MHGMDDTEGADTPLDAVLLAGRELGAAAVFFHSRVAEVLGLGPTDTKFLDLLGRLGALTPKDLAERTGLAPASITAIIDRLEGRDLVRRRDHPDDGRRVLVELDPSAFSRIASHYEDLSRRLVEAFSGHGPDELRLIADVFRRAAAAQMAAAIALESAD